MNNSSTFRTIKNQELINKNFAQSIWNINENEKYKIFSSIKQHISNVNYEVYNFLNNTTGNHREAGIIWIIRNILEKRKTKTNKITDNIFSSFSKYTDNSKTNIQ